MLVYWVWLSLAVIPGAKGCHKLLESFGNAERIYTATKEQLTQCEGLKKKELASLCDKSLYRAESIIRKCALEGIKIISMEDDGYPPSLKNVFSPPPVIYCRGRLPDFEKQHAVTVVGTRQSTSEGERIAYDFSSDLAEYGFVIISGAASGIDTIANRCSLDAKMPTVAVLGCGVDVAYPAVNIVLLEEIAQKGAVISEFPPGTPARPHHFPVRNRIMAALGLGTLVIEAPERSGALITAGIALDMGKEVFAVSGSIYHSGFAGSNALIKKGGAAPVTSPEDVAMGLPVEFKRPVKEKKRIPLDKLRLTPDEKEIAELILHHRRLNLDEILSLSKLPEGHVLISITTLEMKGIVVHEGANIYTVYE